MEKINNKVQTYEIELTTTGPLFIGSGKTLNKKEYMKQGQIISVIDMNKMNHGLLSLSKLDAYEDYMLTYSNREDLGSWFSKNKITKETYQKWIRYSFACDLEREQANKTEIQTFLKDSYGCPYVPGSSLKGCLRTILLSYLENKRKTEFQDLRSRIKQEAERPTKRGKAFLAAEASELESRAFHTLKRKDPIKNREIPLSNAVNSIMSGMVVSDSRPLSVENLILCQKMDMTKGHKTIALPIARECIKPGTKIYFSLTLKEEFPLTIEEIQEAIKYFAGRYYNCFLKFFKDEKYGINLPTVRTIWFGGGSGFVSKTVVYPLFGYEQGLDTVSKILHQTTSNPRLHDNDVEDGVSPHMIKCTRYQGKFYEFGRCTIKFT